MGTRGFSWIPITRALFAHSDTARDQESDEPLCSGDRTRSTSPTDPKSPAQWVNGLGRRPRRDSALPRRRSVWPEVLVEQSVVLYQGIKRSRVGASSRANASTGGRAECPPPVCLVGTGGSMSRGRPRRLFLSQRVRGYPSSRDRSSARRSRWRSQRSRILPS